MTCAIFSATGRPQLYLDVPVVLVTAVVLQSPMGWLSPEVLFGHAPHRGCGPRVPVSYGLVKHVCQDLSMLLVMVMVSGSQSPMSWLSSKVPSNVLYIVVAAAVLQSLMMFEPALLITLERLLVNPLRICPETLALQSLPPRGLARAARLFSAWCWDLGCGTKSQPQAHYE